MTDMCYPAWLCWGDLSPLALFLFFLFIFKYNCLPELHCIVKRNFSDTLWCLTCISVIWDTEAVGSDYKASLETGIRHSTTQGKNIGAVYSVSKKLSNMHMALNLISSAEVWKKISIRLKTDFIVAFYGAYTLVICDTILAQGDEQ